MSKQQDWSLLNGLALAYVGDAAYELVIRKHLLESGQTRPNELHRRATQFVSAKAQNRLITAMMEENVLTEEELAMFKRGRNAKSHTTAKNADVATYRASTGFETLMGYLYMQNHHDRFNELTQWCIKKVEEDTHV